MKKRILLMLLGMLASAATFALDSIYGPVTLCQGNSAYLYDSTSGGVWSSSSPGVASINASTGTVTAISAGSTTITYTLGSDYVTASLSVFPVPDPISLSSTYGCAGSMVTATDATSGGTWSAAGSSISSAGVFTTPDSGFAIIYYTVSGCSVRAFDTTISTYVSSIIGPTTICLGATGTESVTGTGTWSSSSTAVASVNSAGMVTGLALGTTVISYAVTGACGTAVATQTVTVSNTTDPGTITGTTSVYTGISTTLFDPTAAAGGTWSSSDPSVATVDPSTGTVTGISTGSATISYTVDGCSGMASATTTVTVSVFTGSSLTGPTSGCAGSTYYLYDSLYYGGTWSSSDSTVARVDSYGDVFALSAGTAVISYYYGGAYITSPFTVNASPEPITETITTFCPGATAICYETTTGGSWSASPSYIATVNSSGVVTGIASGSVDIFYTLPDGCNTYITDLVSGTYAGSIYSSGFICVGSTYTISDSSIVAGGTWSSSDPAIATVDAGGDVTGIATGTATIYYSVTGTCGVGTASTTVTVSNTTDAGTIYGAGSVVVGSTLYLYDYSSTSSTYLSGTWSTSDASIATVDGSGNLTGIAPGTVTVTFSTVGCGGVGTSTAAVTVTSLNGISGNVLFGGTPYYGTVTVYLITYDPTTLDLEALDSEIVYAYGSSASYEFTGIPTDSFRVKAAAGGDSSYIDTGYVPTYHTSSCYWGTANVIYHTAGSSDINENINMAFGSASSGPGFIGGSVLTGAGRESGRSTSTGIAVPGLLIFCIDATSGSLMQQTYTNASGDYSFSNLPLGTYYVYPEALNYATTPFTGITLTSSSASAHSANFVQHNTVPLTITPSDESTVNVVAASSSAIAFPNPANSTLNILWQDIANEKATVTITDMAGREVYTSSLNLTIGSGATVIDISSITSGLYIVSVKSDRIDYNNKIQVIH